MTGAITADKAAIDAKTTLAEVTGYTLTGTAAKAALVLLTYSIALDDADDIDFGNQGSGYTSSSILICRIMTTTGTGDITNLNYTITGINPTAFTLVPGNSVDDTTDPLWSSILTASHEYGSRYYNNFRVYPNEGLPSGTYSAIVTLTADHGVSLSFNVSFQAS